MMAIKANFIPDLIPRSLLPILLASILIIVACSGDDKNLEILEPPVRPQQMINLGSADGKTYYAEVDQTMTWAAAKSYCESANLKLASIQTRNQVELLKRSLSAGSHDWTYFWTSARESQKPTMLTWDESESQVDGSLFDEWDLYLGEYFYCVSLVVDTDMAGMLANNCSRRTNFLCEL